ncbi:hypothetical protein ACFOHK_07610 [Falsigemmobacter intermedius]|uniref:Uncharacterized protein n=1 Tax=Falsigemmobacter intermedius TaxID=1553448 RepID=A0A444ME17_9RHOB|nr:hypothetical protein [Falsigemmobacter intermedius]RWY43054.1 hypothetical protein EP867_06130 [Falsigemmobacter intermedius]
MADHHAPIVRLFGPGELPVRIPDWPEAVGLAVCRVEGKTLAFVPWHVSEKPQVLRRRLVNEAGPALQGFVFYPAAKGSTPVTLPPGEDARILGELDSAMRGLPRLLEEANDFAINFEFAAEEGLSLDALSDGNRRKAELAAKAQPVITDQLPVGYVPFVKADPDCEMIAGAVLRPAGAAGVDLVLQPNANARELPAEVSVLVREDSLRVAIQLGPILVNGRLPAVLRLPSGALMLGKTGGRPVPAMVLRRSGMLFVAPDYSAVATAPQPSVPEAKKASKLPWVWILGGLLALVTTLAVAGAVVWALQPAAPEPQPLAPVEDLRSNLFAPAPQ